MGLTARRGALKARFARTGSPMERFETGPPWTPQISGASFNQPFRGLPVLQPTLPRIPDSATTSYRPCGTVFALCLVFLFILGPRRGCLKAGSLRKPGSPINGCKTASGSLPEASGLLGACKTASGSLLKVPTFQKPLPPWNGCKTTPGGGLLEAPTPSGMVVKRFRVVFKSTLILDPTKG